MRAYRARKRGAPAAAKPAAAKPAAAAPRPAIPLGRELTQWEKNSDVQLEAIEARGGKAEWTGKEWREAPGPPTPRPAVSQAASPGRALTVARAPLQGEVIAPPRSMIADGGSPPRRYAPGASIAEATAMIRAYAAEQARVNAETARRLEAVEREQAETAKRLATLEERREGVFAIVRGLAGMFSLIGAAR